MLLCGAAAAARWIKGGNKRGLPGPTLLWRCLTDSQQLGPRSPPCRGQAAGLRGPEVTCPSLDRGEERGKVLDGRVTGRGDVYVCVFLGHGCYFLEIFTLL